MTQGKPPPVSRFLKLVVLLMGVALFACVGIPLLALGAEYRSYAILVILFALVMLLFLGRGMTSKGA